MEKTTKKMMKEESSSKRQTRLKFIDRICHLLMLTNGMSLDLFAALFQVGLIQRVDNFLLSKRVHWAKETLYLS